MRPIWQLTKCDALLGSTPFYVDRLLPFVTSEQRAKKTKKTLRFEDETSCTDAREQVRDRNLCCNVFVYLFSWLSVFN